MSGVNFFGVRHLSPAGAFYLEQFLDSVRPKLVLIEAPSDFADTADDIVRAETKPPFAILAYTNRAPVRTILYPFAEYSPEYRAILWCRANNAELRFMDLPSDVFLALYEKRVAEETAAENDINENAGEERQISVYERLDMLDSEGHETFWERTLEHCADFESYRGGANLFGANIREFSEKTGSDLEETRLREAYMRGCIRSAVESGIAPESIAVVTGAYHVEGLKPWETPENAPELPHTDALHTLMPYSYYRLSTRSGYGAGNRAPAYYELIWESYRRGDPQYAANAYLSKIAEKLRENGNAASSAQIIEAVRLANSLAAMRKGSTPALRDLRDAAETCLGEGSFAAISVAAADTEIGTKIGALPEGVSRTSIQDDFYRQLKDLKLDKYRTVTAQDLRLDLRENLRAKGERSAFLDLNRSSFLHKLRVLGISFAEPRISEQDNATWSEAWVLRWTPESEIQLVESALRGDTVELAASFALKETVEKAANMSEVAAAVEDAFLCGMSSAANYAVSALQAMAVDAASFEELAKTAFRLSSIVTYGDIRKADSSPLIPILQQIYYRACLILPSSCVCDDNASQALSEAMNRLNTVELAQECLETESWLNALKETARRDDLNTRLSGFSAAILLERGRMTNDELKLEVSRRLSKGVPADLGAGWFEGLTLKNRYGLIARLSLWESLDEYIRSLDDEEFKRALVFLRRAFADFSSGEKDSVAENLGELWGLNGAEVSEAVNAELDAASQEQIAALDDFDFDI
ncbi:MAG: DUF5682 family protein [Lachnospiraceae bacterium]|nr:DUF5682 family protein [Ruminococcus sp.]MCM1274081.1 DUF5682 family protein [Lachnospiraceae bacterium]